MRFLHVAGVQQVESLLLAGLVVALREQSRVPGGPAEPDQEGARDAAVGQGDGALRIRDEGERFRDRAGVAGSDASEPGEGVGQDLRVQSSDGVPGEGQLCGGLARELRWQIAGTCARSG